MQAIGSYALPIIVALIVLWGLIKRVKVFDCFLEGAREGVQTAMRILPNLVGLLVAVAMLSASGGLDMLCYALQPVSALIGLPREVLPLALISPFSGGGKLAVFENMLTQYGPDTFVGRVASVMMGSTETTFYAVSVYYGSVGVQKTRATIPAALTGDVTSFILSALLIRLFFQ